MYIHTSQSRNIRCSPLVLSPGPDSDAHTWSKSRFPQPPLSFQHLSEEVMGSYQVLYLLDISGVVRRHHAYSWWQGISVRRQAGVPRPGLTRPPLTARNREPLLTHRHVYIGSVWSGVPPWLLCFRDSGYCLVVITNHFIVVLGIAGVQLWVPLSMA